MRYSTLATIATFVWLPATASAGETITYRYDVLGRLTGVSHSGTVNDGATTTYAYDRADNRTLHKIEGYRPSQPPALAPRTIIVPLGGLHVIPLS